MKIIYFSFIFFYLIKQITNYYVFPLKVIDKLDKIENFLSFNSTYTILEIGTPKQIVNFYFSVNHNKMYMTDIGCRNTNLYYFNLESSSLNIIGGIDFDSDQPNNKIIFFESLYFFNDTNLSQSIEMEEYPLLLLTNFTEEVFETGICGDIGLAIMQYENYENEPDEFEYYMKYLKTLNNYFSFFYYNGSDYLINSIFLHLEFKDLFQDVKNISWVNPILRNEMLHWEINMKEIFYNKVHFNNKIILELNPLFELIIGTNDYKNNITKDFFNSYINKGICSMVEIDGYTLFECDEKHFDIKDIKNFPTLYMFNNDINHIFEMKGEELFHQLNNKYYFKIIFPIKDLVPSRWVIGKIFFRKYPTIFSPSNRLIGFYINPNEGIIEGLNTEDNENNEDNENENNNNKSSNNRIYVYIIIGVVAIIFTVLGIFIGKKIFLKKKRKANELIDDNYQYEPQNNIN